MFKNKYNLIILALGLVFVLGGCLKKDSKIEVKNDQQPVVVDSQNSNVNINSNQNISTDCKDELDIKCWKTYRNEEYGFGLRYPKNINTEIDMEMQISKYDENRVAIFFLNKKGSFSIFPRGEFDMGLGISIGSSKILVGGGKATRDEYKNLSYITFEDKKEINKFFRIELHYFKGYENDKNFRNTLNKMLQSFKFIK